LHDILLEAPDGVEGLGEVAAARRIVAGALAAGRSALDPMEVQSVLRAYGVTTLEARIVHTPHEAGVAAAAVGQDVPVALKIQSPDISHKSDVGGVELDLRGDLLTERAAEAMLSRVKTMQPDARLEGFLVQPMVSRPKAHEILVGMTRDPTFGPVVVVGHGGVAVEAVADRALGLPPLNAVLGRDMIAQTRVACLLAGYRDRSPADIEALAHILTAVGRLCVDIPEIAEMDLNPVLCDDKGALVLDARIGLRQADATTARPAILPYPGHLARNIEVDGQVLRLRPIRPTDATRLIEMVDRCSVDDVHLRFYAGMQRLDPNLAARLSQIDYDRHMALVAETESQELVGVGRLVEDPEGETAEFALMVRGDHQAHGLGHALLRAVLDYAASRGLREVWGEVARENARMLDVARDLGFATAVSGGDMSRVHVTKTLARTPS
jgi:acetyltransferase